MILLLPEQRHLTFFPPHVSDPAHGSVSICSLISHISLCSVTFQYHSHYTHSCALEHKSFSCLNRKVLGVIKRLQFQPYFADPSFSSSPLLNIFKLLGIKLLFAILFPQIIFASFWKMNRNFLPLLY